MFESWLLSNIVTWYVLSTRRAEKNMEFRSKMHWKSHANHARAANLQRDKRYPSQPTTIEEVKEDNFHGPDSHDCWDAPRQDSDDIIGDDAKFLEIIGCLRGSNCCCHRLLFSQPDFVNQKSQLEELITLCGHICDFYPKYHCDWTILGCSQILLLQLSQQANNNQRDGKLGPGMLRQHPSPSNLAVSNLIFYLDNDWNRMIPKIDMPTDQCGLWMDMQRDWQVLMLFGWVGSIEDTEFCPNFAS